MFKDIKEKNIFIMTERREMEAIKGNGSNKERPNENSGTEKNNV